MKFIEGPKATCEGCSKHKGTANLEMCRECKRWLCHVCYGKGTISGCETCKNAEPVRVIRLGGNVDEPRTELFMDDHDGGGWS